MMKERSSVYGMRNERRISGSTTTSTSSGGGGGRRNEEAEWEMRPGGMLVQKRSDSGDGAVAVPSIRVRVAYGAIRYEISVNPQTTFGGLKNLLTAETALQPTEQRLVFRGKERGDRDYLDTCGVKDRSKVVLVQDPMSIERRYVEMRRNASVQSVHRSISDVSIEVDKLAEQVYLVEKSIAKGNKVPEVQITTLVEMLMRQAVKLDNIAAEGDAASSKNSQGKRVQKCVETLDALRISNARIKPVVVTTTWETFDPPSPPRTRSSNPQETGPWELFD